MSDSSDKVLERNVFYTPHRVGQVERERLCGHRGGVIWFTGISGSGKSTLAMELERALFDGGFLVYVLDGDNLRRGLNADLGFGAANRAENIRRAGEVASLFADAGFVCIAAFISPYAADRASARRAASDKVFVEVYLQADITICERRDHKGLYKRARAGEIPEFTGISAPYEVPTNPDVAIDTGSESVESCVDRLVTEVRARFLVAPSTLN